MKEDTGGGVKRLYIACDYMETDILEAVFIELILHGCSSEFSQLALSHDLPFPVVTQRDRLFLCIFRQLQQTQPLGDSV